MLWDLQQQQQEATEEPLQMMTNEDRLSFYFCGQLVIYFTRNNRLKLNGNSPTNKVPTNTGRSIAVLGAAASHNSRAFNAVHLISCYYHS